MMTLQEMLDKKTYFEKRKLWDLVEYYEMLIQQHYLKKQKENKDVK